MNEETKTQAELSQEPNPKQSVGAFVWDLFKILIIALLIIVPFRAFIAEPFVVSGSSMLPNYHNRDYLIIDRFSYRNGSPQRGDVVVLNFPKDPSQYYIKRIIGLPGERIKVAEGRITVYNEIYPEGVEINETYLQKDLITLGEKITVLQDNQFFVLGDNRNNSFDSRRFGPIDRGSIVGRTWVRGWPLSRIQTFRAPNFGF
jgi:signal peptidase I